MNPCVRCQKLTKNYKFCSRTCSVSFNNRVKPKRSKKPKICRRCGDSYIIQKKNQKLCDSCDGWGGFPGNFRYKTIGELRESRKNSPWPQSLYNTIRDRARRVMKSSGRLDSCEICGYSVHVETAHIRPVNSFNNQSTIDEINAMSNLKGLCPNHHWEFDHGLLVL